MKKTMTIRKGGSKKVDAAEGKKLDAALAKKMDQGIKDQHRKKPGSEKAAALTDKTQESDHAG